MLKDMFGLPGKVLEWFRSYLEQCSQRVSVHGFSYLVYHRVQFLVLWFSQCIPVLLYANDTQLYISLDPDNELKFSSSLKILEHCIADIRLWMTQNLLKLNNNKTNII